MRTVQNNSDVAIPSTDILGIDLSQTTLDEVVHFAKERSPKQTGYICLPNMFVAAHRTGNPALAKALDNSTMNLPDGKPLEWVMKLKGHKKAKTISGYWLMKRLLATDLRHYFYGVNDNVLRLIEQKIRAEFPNANLVGMSAPPMIEENLIADNTEITNDFHKIRALQPDIIWVGMSSPKQDIVMREYHHLLDKGLMIGVGAVFNYVAGTEKISPEWMKQMGLRWLYRLWQNPKLLGKYISGCWLFVRLLLTYRSH